MQWKYKVIPLPSSEKGEAGKDEALLNQLGQDGWELVSVSWVPVKNIKGMFDFSGTVRVVSLAYLKREQK